LADEYYDTRDLTEDIGSQEWKVEYKITNVSTNAFTLSVDPLWKLNKKLVLLDSTGDVVATVTVASNVHVHPNNVITINETGIIASTSTNLIYAVDFDSYYANQMNYVIVGFDNDSGYFAQNEVVNMGGVEKTVALYTVPYKDQKLTEIITYDPVDDPPIWPHVKTVS